MWTAIEFRPINHFFPFHILLFTDVNYDTQIIFKSIYVLCIYFFNAFFHNYVESQMNQNIISWYTWQMIELKKKTIFRSKRSISLVLSTNSIRWIKVNKWNYATIEPFIHNILCINKESTSIKINKTLIDLLFVTFVPSLEATVCHNALKASFLSFIQRTLDVSKNISIWSISYHIHGVLVTKVVAICSVYYSNRIYNNGLLSKHFHFHPWLNLHETHFHIYNFCRDFWECHMVSWSSYVILYKTTSENVSCVLLCTHIAHFSQIFIQWQWTKVSGVCFSWTTMNWNATKTYANHKILRKIWTM